MKSKARTRCFPWYGAAALAAAALLSPLPTAATVTWLTTVPRMVKVSDLVVEASVLDFFPRDLVTEDAGKLCPSVQLRYTDIVLDVHQVYKGRLSRPILVVRVLGGEEQGSILEQSYLPFRKGERLLLFLQMNGDDDFPFPGFFQGIQRLRRSAAGRTMPDPDLLSGSCPTCVPMVLDGRDHPVRALSPEGYLHTWNERQRPGALVTVGPGQALVPAEAAPTSLNGVFPVGEPLPSELLTPAELRDAVRSALIGLGLPSDPPQLGDPGAPLARELMVGEPIVRCGTPALLSDEDEAFEIVPGGDDDPPIIPGPSEAPAIQSRTQKQP